MRPSRTPAFGWVEIHAEDHARHDHADGDHRVVSAAVVVRCEPARPIVQGGTRRLAVSRAISRRSRRDHQRAGGGGARHRHRRRQPLRSRGRRQVVVLLSDRAAGRHPRPPLDLAGLDGPARAQARPYPVGGAGGLSAGGRHREADARAARIRRPVADRPAPQRPAGQIRHDLRAGSREHAVERALCRRQGDGARPVRHHERRVARTRRRRLPGDPGRGAAPSRADDAARLHRRRPRIPDARPSTASSTASKPRSGPTPAGATPTSSASIGKYQATNERCRICCN